MQTITSLATTKRVNTCLVASGAAYLLTHYSIATTVENEKRHSKHADGVRKGIIETDLMEKIANKSYLQPLGSVYSGNRKRSFVRPEGVPSEMRVLVIDVPEFRHVFDEECRVDLSHIFTDGVAPPKRVTVAHHSEKGGETNDANQNRTKSQSTTIEVVQKTLARSVAHCGKKKGVVLLEASIGDMVRNREDIEKGPSLSSKSNANKKKIDKDKSMFYHPNKEKNEEENKYSNQYAWIEELRMRINGRVPFGAILERSSPLSMYLFGNVYRWKTRWFNFRFWKSSSGHEFDVNQMKPHAVIADGKALYSIPGALNELVSSCRTSEVPLWVINDPRVWVSNNDDLDSAATAMRQDIRERIIHDALNALQSVTFERGRQLGTAEADAKNSARNMAATAKRLAQSLKGDSWKNLSKDELRRELIRRGVCHSIIDSNVSTDELECTDVFIQLCHTAIAYHQTKTCIQGTFIASDNGD